MITARLKSYPVERRFSQYRQKSGGRFLDNLGEALNSKMTLRCRSLIKENEVTTGSIAKKLIKQSHCESYKILLSTGDADIANYHNKMFFLVVDYLCHQSQFLFYFAILDFVRRQPLTCAVMDQNLIL